MNTRTAAAGVALASALVYWGCQDEPEHPPFTAPCPTGPTCVPRGGVSGPGQGGTGSEEPGDGGDAGAAGAPDAIIGVVRELVDDRFDTTIAFDDPAVVEAQGAVERFARATYNGFDPFVLQGVAAGDPIWILVRPEQNRDVLPTLHPIDPRAVDENVIDFGIVRESTLDVIFSLANDQSGNGRIAGTGQAILLFTNPAGDGIPGIEVTFPGADFVSYGGAWVSGETETDQTGLVLIANIVTSAFPGSTKRVTLSGAATGFVDIRVAADAVSLVEVPLR